MNGFGMVLPASSTSRSILACAVALSLVLPLWSACSSDSASPDDLTIGAVSPEIVLHGTLLVVSGTGFPSEADGTLIFRLSGKAGDSTLKTAGVATVDDYTEASWALPLSFVDELLTANTPFDGHLTVERKLTETGETASATTNVVLHAAVNLQPSATSMAPTSFALGDRVTVEGSGFLYPGEGQTLLVLSGVYNIVSPPSVLEIPKLAIPLDVDTRTSASFEITPDRLSLYTGEFEGLAHLQNITPEYGVQEASEPLQLNLILQPTEISSLSPGVIRRGQYVQVAGRGFLPESAVSEIATVIELEGKLETSDGSTIQYSGAQSLLWFPDSTGDNSNMTLVLRPQLDESGKAVGFGTVPGTFLGKATPVVLYGGNRANGSSIEVSFDIAQPLQVVYVKFLPSFDDAFNDFGLWEVREIIKEQIVERAQFFYDGINIDFRDSRPTDFAEYSVIELSADDPNNADLLGLDNTTGKDVGNVRFNDVIGGMNAETSEQGYYAYGGVFLRSFLGFSPTIKGKGEAMASPRFDDIFGPFAPELGGKPVGPDELDSSPRAEAIDEAIRVLANLVGSTVAHEVGHSLGLAIVPGHPEEYHNLGDNPGWLMDSGVARPFAERAEIDGKGPEFFEEASYNYLISILPMD